MLKFSKANAKTRELANHPNLAAYLSGRRKVYSFDLPAGKTCPGAKDCRSQCVPNAEGTGFVVQDGPGCKFRCFSASQEALFPAVRKARQHNFDVIHRILCLPVSDGKKTQLMRTTIIESMPSNIGVCRLHVSGDFFHPLYLRAWKDVAIFSPNVLFYAYTKSLQFFERSHFLAPRVGRLFSNFYVTASRGGHFDNMIPQLGIRSSKVVFDESQAGRMPIDHDDSHAATSGYSFALLLHGVQPKGSTASVALQALKKRGVGSYSRKGGE